MERARGPGETAAIARLSFARYATRVSSSRRAQRGEPSRTLRSRSRHAGPALYAILVGRVEASRVDRVGRPGVGQGRGVGQDVDQRHVFESEEIDRFARPKDEIVRNSRLIEGELGVLDGRPSREPSLLAAAKHILVEQEAAGR